VRAQDTFGATEQAPVRLRLGAESIPTGVVPRLEVLPGTASSIATGGMLPRGADAVVPVEHTDVEGAAVVVRRAAVPGGAVSFAGTDIGRGETVLFRGAKLTSRETGVLAAIGKARVRVVRRPRVAILGEMAELGAASERYHDEIGELAHGLGVGLIGVGDKARAYHPAVWVADAEHAVDAARTVVKPGDVVLVKASRAVGLEGIAALITNFARAWFPS